MTAFLTLTLNPALDLSTTTEHLEHTHKMRCGTMLRHPGGGGINVARVLHRLGAPVQAWHLSGGVTGAHTCELLAAEGVPMHALPIAGTTRENLSVVETRSGHEYRFVLPGPTVLAHEWQDCLRHCEAAQRLGIGKAHARTSFGWLAAFSSCAACQLWKR